MVQNKSNVWILKQYFKGEPKLSDFVLREEILPDIKDGELICEAEYLSVDPYMRKYMSRFPEGTPMICTQIAKVIESKNEKYPKNSYIYGHFGWRTKTLVSEPENKNVHPILPYPCPDLGNLPRSYALGCCGRPGNSAYFGLLELCQPKEGETVIVSGAAGAVGCLVGQIAKLKGCKTVIGIAGTDEKCEWLVKTLGFDSAINYKTADIPEELKKLAPNGIDCYFDNVGGMISYHIIRHMNQFGRIAICGSISSYNCDDDIPLVPQINNFHRNNLRMEGFLVNRWVGERWFEGIYAIRDWIQQGHIKYNETVTNGFENMPQAFIDMLNGSNFGKAIVKV